MFKNLKSKRDEKRNDMTVFPSSTRNRKCIQKYSTKCHKVFLLDSMFAVIPQLRHVLPQPHPAMFVLPSLPFASTPAPCHASVVCLCLGNQKKTIRHRGLTGIVHGFYIFNDCRTGERQATQTQLPLTKTVKALRTKICSYRSQLRIWDVIR